MAVAILAEGPAVSYQSSGNSCARVGNTPRALWGQGQKAVRGRPIGGPFGHIAIVVPGPGQLLGPRD